MSKEKIDNSSITKKLDDIEARFLGWVRLSDQQNEDIIWLITTLRHLGYKGDKNGNDVHSGN